jgi:uncharacterized repeat protein (TIGR02543 family)
MVNDEFTFPLLTSTQLNQASMFYETFYGLGATTTQTRTATSIINGNNIPNSNRRTFLSSNCFVDRKYIAVNWGGDGLACTVTYLSGTQGTWDDTAEVYSSVPYGISPPIFGTQSGADVTVDHEIGYKFSGWKDKNTDITYNINDPLPVVTGIIIYEAQWRLADYFVAYNLGATDASISGGVTSKSVSWNEAGLLPSVDPIRPAYKFVGWQLVHDGYASVVGGKFPVGVFDKFSDFAYDATVDGVVFIACWFFLGESFEDEFVVVYKGNGNTGGVAPVDSKWYVVGDRVTVLGQGSLVRDGYVFLGWSTSPQATTPLYTVGSIFTIQNGDVVLYAVWSQNLYTVEYRSGAHGTFAAQVTGGLIYGDLTPKAPTVTGETGWNFTGWSPTPSVTVTGNAIYVAQWVQVTLPPPSASPSVTPPITTSPPTPSTPSSSPSTPVTSPPSVTTAPPASSAPPTLPPEVVVSMWAVVNLIFAVLGVIVLVGIVVVVVFMLLKRKGRGVVEKQMIGRRGWLLWLVLAVVGVLVFLFTEDVGVSMTLVDKWTVVHVVLFAVESSVAYLCLKTVKGIGASRHI